MRKSEQNRDLHYFASNLIVERVPCEGLSKVTPQRDILTVPNSMFLLDDAETRKLREDFKVLVGRILVDRFTSLAFMKSIIPTHIESKYPVEIAQKSTIIPLSMQFKEEKKYDDVVDILCSYENTLEDIYSKAGIIKVPKGTVKLCLQYMPVLFIHVSALMCISCLDNLMLVFNPTLQIANQQFQMLVYLVRPRVLINLAHTQEKLTAKTI